MKRNKKLTFTCAPLSNLNPSGMNAAVIGGTGGLGREIAKSFASRGAQVTVVGQTFRDEGSSNLTFLKADLSLMREARRVASELPAEKLDLVVFTTGIVAATKRQETAEGLERDMAISYLSRLVILREIAPRLGTARTSTLGSTAPRIFVMGFPGTGQAGTLGDLNADRGYSAMTVHMNTVAGNEMLVLDAAQRFPNVATFGLNPGLIRTNIRDNFLGHGSLKSRVMEALIGLFTPTPQTYAERITPLLLAPELTGHSGALFNQKGEAIEPSPRLLDRAHVARFLGESQALIDRTTP